MLTHSTASTDSDGSSSSSNGTDVLLERVIDVTPEGLILEYDLATEEGLLHGRQDQWQYPFRVLKPVDGPMRLLNADELEARIGPWLEHSKIPRSACGQPIFTWDAFRIECDPQSVMEGISSFDTRPAELREGAPFQEPGASGSAPLQKGSEGPGGTTYVVRLPVDADWVRREKAEADVVVGEISRDPVTLEEALRARSGEEISGTISIIFDVDPQGGVRRRTKTTELKTRDVDGAVEDGTATETLVRRRLGSEAESHDTV